MNNPKELLEVEKFQKDLSLFFEEQGLDNNHVPKKWLIKFKKHYNAILPLANSGISLAQYSIAMYYMFALFRENGLQSKQDFIEDTLAMNQWLIKAAKQGHIGAMDNLLSSQHGEEPEKLRNIYQNSKNMTHAAPPLQGWKDDMNLLIKLAYKNS